MTNHVYQHFSDAYVGLLRDVYESPDYICSPRGQKIKEKLGVTFRIQNPLDRLLFVDERKFSTWYVIAEALWYLSGNDSTEWIAKYSSFWSKISDDGKTANSAYGARIFRPHRRCGQRQMIVWSDDAWKNSDTENLNNVELLEDPLDTWTQWQYVLDELAADNDSRRAVMHIRSPLDSRYAKLDVPCTLTLQFFLRDDKVVLNVSMRSSDLWLGIANDIPAFTLFQELMAFELSKKLGRRIGLGEYVHTSNSLHIYERNFSAVENVLAAHPRHVSLATIPMPAFTTPPPIIELMNFESALYQPDVQFQKLLDELHDTFETSGVDQYWYDWAVLLVQRASGKDGVQRRDYLNQCIWPGYKILG